MANLGKIDKPDAKIYLKSKRLLVVNIVGNIPTTDEAKKSVFKKTVEKYWIQVRSQLEQLSSKLGQIKAIFHEYISVDEENGLSMLKKLDKHSYEITKELVNGGSHLFALEDSELLMEVEDWQKCMMVGLSSQKAYTKVFEQFKVAAGKRDQFMTEILNNSLKPNDTGLIFVSSSKQFRFPKDIELFFISPPALNDIDNMMQAQYSQKKS